MALTRRHLRHAQLVISWINLEETDRNRLLKEGKLDIKGSYADVVFCNFPL